MMRQESRSVILRRKAPRNLLPRNGKRPEQILRFAQDDRRDRRHDKGERFLRS